MKPFQTMLVLRNPIDAPSRMDTHRIFRMLACLKFRYHERRPIVHEISPFMPHFLPLARNTHR